ncbi:MAG: hypothetical protein ACP5PQ_07425 [Thermoproteota archaeon]
MSRQVLDVILAEMHVLLSVAERDQLYRELLAYFGLVGAVDECEALDNAWRDPYNRLEIEEFIKAWIRRRRKCVEELATGVV